MGLEDLTADQLLAKAREMEGSHSLVQTLSKDPEARHLFQRFMKKKNPNLSIPEVDTEDRVTKLVEDERKAREEFQNKVTEQQARERVERERARVKATYKLSDDDMKGVELLMVPSETNQYPIPSYEGAAQVFKARSTPSTPSPISLSPPIYTMPDKETWGKGIGNPAELNRIAMRQAYDAFNEIRQGKVAGV